MTVQAKNLRELSHEELLGMQAELSAEIFELKSELKMARELEQPHLLPQRRRDLARILTVMREQELGQKQR